MSRRQTAMLDPRRQRAADKLRSEAMLAATAPRAEPLMPTRPVAKHQSKTSVTEDTKTQKTLERFERNVNALIGAYRRTVHDACVKEAERIGVPAAGPFVSAVSGSVDDLHEAKTTKAFAAAGSAERAKAAQKEAFAMGNLMQGARAVNEARYGKEGALVVELMGAAAAVRHTAAQDIRTLLREEARAAEAKTPSGNQFHWSDRLFGGGSSMAAGAGFDEEDGGSVGKSRRTTTGRRTTRQAEAQEDEGTLRRRVPVPREQKTMEELLADVDASTRAMELEDRSENKEPRAWSILEFMITNPCMRRTLRISDALDRMYAAVEGPADDSFTATGGRTKKLGLIGRASQYARGAIEEAERAGVYNAQSTWGTGTGMIILGRVLTFITLRLQMNAHASNRFDSQLEDEMRKSVAKTHENLLSVQTSVGDAEATNNAWKSLLTIVDPENPDRVIPRPNTGEILAQSVYQYCGNNEGMARVAAMAASEPPAAPVSTGDSAVDAFLGTVFAPSHQMIGGGSSSSSVSSLLTTREAASGLTPAQSTMALNFMIQQVGRLSSANSPVVAMASIVSEKVGIDLSNAAEQVFNTNQGLSDVEDRIADVATTSFVTWSDDLSSMWTQAMYGAFPDIMSFGLTGRVLWSALAYVSPTVQQLAAAEFSSLGSSVVGGLTDKVLGPGMAFATDTWMGGVPGALEGLGKLLSGTWFGFDITTLLPIIGGGGVAGIIGAYLWLPAPIRALISGPMTFVLNLLPRVWAEMTKTATFGSLVLEGMSNGGLVSLGLRLIGAIITAAAGLLDTDAENSLIKKIMNSGIKTLANLIYAIATPVAAAVFKVSRIVTGAYTGLFMLQQVTLLMMSIIAPTIASIPLAMPILVTLGVGIGGMFLLPPDILKNSTPMWLYNNTLGRMRVMAYRVVDPIRKVLLAMLPASIRNGAAKIGGFFGAVGNLLCTRPEIGIFAFTLISIWATSGSEFIWNRCLLGNVHDAGAAKTARAAQRKAENERFERVRDFSSRLTTEGRDNQKLQQDTYAMLLRYAATICGIGEGSLTGPTAYRSIRSAFLSGWAPEAGMFGPDVLSTITP